MRLKRFWLGLLAVYSLFIIYGTQFPFFFPTYKTVFQSASPGVMLEVFFRKANVSSADIIQNILLFLPFGFLSAKWLESLFRSAVKKWVCVLATAFLFSYSIEMIQLVSMTRFTSLIDLIFNVLGAALGIAAAQWMPIPPLLRRYEEPVKRYLSMRWGLPALGAMALLLLETWRPFNFSLVTELPIKKVAIFWSTVPRWNPELVVFAARYGFTVALGSSLLCAWLLELNVKKFWWKAFWIYSAFGCFLEGMQLFIVSRMPSLWEAGVIVAGSLAGVLGFLFLPQKSAWSRWIFWGGFGCAMALLFTVSLPGTIDTRQAARAILGHLPEEVPTRFNMALHYLTLFFFMGFISAYMVYRYRVMPRRTLVNMMVFSTAFFATLFWTKDMSALLNYKKSLPVVGGITMGLVSVLWLLDCFRDYFFQKSKSVPGPSPGNSS